MMTRAKAALTLFAALGAATSAPLLISLAHAQQPPQNGGAAAASTGCSNAESAATTGPPK